MRLTTAVFVFTAFMHAEVVDSAAGGFTVKTVLNIKASPEDVYNKFTHNIGDWWNSTHTFSGDAKNLRIEDRPGGCFCEKLPNNGFVRHLEVVYLVPGKAVTLNGGLGPMQSVAVAGSMVIKFSPADGGTKFEMTYSVNGYSAKGMTSWAAPVDMVTAEQFTRMKNYIETGSPAPAASK